MTDVHDHACPICGTVWRHDRDTIVPSRVGAAHDCPMPECGGHQGWRYGGESAATLWHDGTTTVAIGGQACAERVSSHG